jgi:amphi-Trp domain-containing protein
LGKREVGKGQTDREEAAAWLEEMAARIRTGALMVDGEVISVPEESYASVKSKFKDGRRRLRFELEWPDERSSGKGKKNKGKNKDKNKGEDKKNKSNKTLNGSQNSPSGALERETPRTNTPERVTNGQACGGGPGESGGGSEKRGSVRDYESHVLVCKGGDCSKKGGRETRKAIKNGLRAEGLNREVRVDSVECLGLCKQGPNVIVYPEGSWYLGLKESDVPEVVEEHLKGGRPVERLAAERGPRNGGAKKAQR